MVALSAWQVETVGGGRWHRWLACVRCVGSCFPRRQVIVLALWATCVQASPAPDSFSCEPGQVSGADTVRIAMPGEHGGEFAILAPDGTFFYVVYRSLPGSPASHSLMTPTEFSTLDSFEIEIATFEALPWRAGSIKRERVFQTPGRYVLRIGKNLESNGPGALLDECMVEVEEPLERSAGS